MTLGMGTSPFGQRPKGRFNFEPPEHVVFVEPFPRRVRATRGGVTVVDSDRVVLVHESRRLARYAFPADDVQVKDAAPDPAAPGYVCVPWDAADAWFEEEEEVFVHVRDPYHRIDVVPTSRHVVASIEGVVLADSAHPHGLYETGLPVRWYFPRDDVDMTRLKRSATVTQCAYKGTTVHWSARLDDGVAEDVAWSYEEGARADGEKVRDLIAFYNERVDLDVDGVRQERPMTPWSRQS
jgi:uncharacterized protein (DUF427 family)